ncbi:MAG: hypothetical protein HYV33_01405 [Candidatus Kerfeldbacteria bacterium]|nr:hypothetical protein [Candidatus Kerfeldbacteria bacterium]
MNIATWFSKTVTGTLALLGIMLATPSFAASNTPLAVFTDTPTAHLVKYHDTLYALNETTTGLATYQRNSDTDWTEVDATDTGLQNVYDHVSSIGQFHAFKKNVYMTTQNNHGVGQMWSIRKNSTNHNWRKSGKAGFGNKHNTAITTMFEKNGRLYAFTSNSHGSKMYSTKSGSKWYLEGSYGLDDVLDVGHFTIGGQKHIWLGTSDGLLYNASPTYFPNWNYVEDFGQSITALYRYNETLYLAAVADDGTTRVMKTSDGINFSQVGSDNLGDDNNVNITKLGTDPFTAQLYVLTENTVTGAQMLLWSDDTASWSAAVTAGLGSVANSQFVDLVEYQDVPYISTFNTANNAEVDALIE